MTDLKNKAADLRRGNTNKERSTSHDRRIEEEIKLVDVRKKFSTQLDQKRSRQEMNQSHQQFTYAILLILLYNNTIRALFSWKVLFILSSPNLNRDKEVKKDSPKYRTFYRHQVILNSCVLTGIDRFITFGYILRSIFCDEIQENLL